MEVLAELLATAGRRGCADHVPTKIGVQICLTLSSWDRPTSALLARPIKTQLPGWLRVSPYAGGEARSAYPEELIAVVA